MPTHNIQITTTKNREVIDITNIITERIEHSTTLVNIFTAHTTAAVTTADLDPGTDLDLLDAVWEMIPRLNYRHPHNPAHVPAHLASSIIGPSVSIPAKSGKLMLGKWQRIILIELDGPRERDLIISLI